MNAWAVIMAGGVGSRFWPLSRKKRPKQLLDLFGDGPMFGPHPNGSNRSLLPSVNSSLPDGFWAIRFVSWYQSYPPKTSLKSRQDGIRRPVLDGLHFGFVDGIQTPS